MFSQFLHEGEQNMIHLMIDDFLGWNNPLIINNEETNGFRFVLVFINIHWMLTESALRSSANCRLHFYDFWDQ